MGGRIGKNDPSRTTTLACWIALVVSVLGCERHDGGAATPAFVPGWNEARQSLESSLSAWRDESSPSPTPIVARGVQFADKTRKPGQRLLSFQILGQSEIENARQFTVRLNLEGEDSPQLVKYNVLGRDPVWVFRLDDYEMLAHWEHDMGKPAPPPVENPKSDTQPAGAN
jgi:hypothetical protein